MKRTLFGSLFMLLFVITAAAQNPSTARRIRYGTPPSTCNPSTGDVYIDTSVTPPDFVRCVATNKWERESTGKVNAQTGTTYTFVKADRNKLTTFNNGSSVAVTLPQATSGGDFLSGWNAPVYNLGAGTVTITPTTSTINGGSSITVAQGEGCWIFSNGTNYSALKTISTTAGAGTVTTTGSPASGKIAAFSGATSITNTDLTGDVTTSGGVATTIANSVVTTAKLASKSGNGTTVGTTSGATSNGKCLEWDANGNIVTAASNAACGSGAGSVTPSSTDTFTNKTYDAEGTGNILTQAFKIWFPAAGCNNATAASFWDLPTSTPAVAACVTGTNTQKGVLQFADTSGGFSAQNSFLLPSDFTGNVDARIIWKTSATSGNAKFSLSTICTAVDATETDDPSFNTASTVTTAAAGTANRLQTSSITSLTITGCAANEFLHLKLFRDGNDGSDTLSASLDVIGVELTIRRAQ